MLQQPFHGIHNLQIQVKGCILHTKYKSKGQFNEESSMAMTLRLCIATYFLIQFTSCGETDVEKEKLIFQSHSNTSSKSGYNIGPYLGNITMLFLYICLSLLTSHVGHSYFFRGKLCIFRHHLSINPNIKAGFGSANLYLPCGNPHVNKLSFSDSLFIKFFRLRVWTSTNGTH